MSRKQLSLNGHWQIAPGQKDTAPLQWSHEIPVPGLADLADPAYEWRTHEYHWYRKGFSVSADDRSPSAFLKIGQAMFGTAVWLNGQHLGGDIACYTSQEYDISSHICRGEENELLVRVGAKTTLPPESAVGKDQERTEFIPGIWGDVELFLTGNPRIKLVQVIPHIDSSVAEARLWIENRSDNDVLADLVCRVIDKKSRKPVSAETKHVVDLPAHAERTVTLEMRIENPTPWSLDNPFLYALESRILNLDKSSHRLESRAPNSEFPLDSCLTTFGMREFKIVGSDFFLNGKRIFLRGGNIAFHRFLSDADRRTLPWDIDWVKRLLIDIPKSHNFNFFRNHLGQMYNRWYDIADEHGLLLQNEWKFWTTTGTKEQITREFTRWLQDNWNHPSIIIWDALNECSDPVVQNEIVPEMKKLDPSRPWESVDFIEQHPYIYSLGPVLNERRFGCTVSLDDIEKMDTPSVVNEFLWWWLDKDWNPTLLTREVVERWLGKDYTQADLVARQSFLAQEVVELFRRMRVDAIQPFVYLSNNAGPTANWFVGDIKELQPKPVMATLKNAFSPFGISLELWDRHFLAGESRAVRLFVFNDDPVARTGRVRYGVVRFDGGWTYETSHAVAAEPGDCYITPIQIILPRHPGEYRIRAELHEDGGSSVTYSEKIAHVFIPPEVDAHAVRPHVLLMESSGEITRFLASHRYPVGTLGADRFRPDTVIVVSDGLVRSPGYAQCIPELSGMVKSGATLVLIEPEYDVHAKQDITALESLCLTIGRRVDAEKGGYDSYVFAESQDHPLWRGIEKKHLQMFNGGFGGEIVSQHDVTTTSPHTVLARCGLQLKVPAVFEVPYGKGSVMVSRLQLRGRLLSSNGISGSLYSRRVDPVAQQYLLNLVAFAVSD